VRLRHLLLPALALVLGCGDSLNYAPVSGKITMDGRPLPDVVVFFQPTGKVNPGPGSAGRTDAEGRYSLEGDGNQRNGALVGTHRVEIHPAVDGSAEGEKHPPPTVRIPIRYNQESELTFEVKPGKNEANFNLSSQEAPVQGGLRR
jgi:hypothetical protein